MIELQTVINDRLSQLVDRVYSEEAPQNAVRPYVVFHLPVSQPNFQREDFTLNIDFWDITSRSDYDPDDIDLLVSTVDGDGDVFHASGLNRYNVYSPGVIQAKFYRVNRLVIPDPNKRIKRRQLVYNVQAYLL